VCQKKRKVFDVTAKRLDGVTDESGRPVDVRVIKKKGIISFLLYHALFYSKVLSGAES